MIGSVIIDGTFNACPYITFYTVVPLQVAVGNNIALQAAADDINAGETLSYSWSATTGTVASSTSANTTYTCTVAGSPTLTLTVSDGSCSDTAEVQVDCITLLCGNGVVDTAAGETCDDGNTAGGDACPGDCTLPVCSDRVIEPPETCDDGNTSNGDTCPSDCTLPVCGDGSLESPETCEPPSTATCDASCVAIPVVCGNGVVQGAEECDDGNTIDDDECTNACTFPAVCGNMEVETGEQCDPPNGTTCDADCQTITVCNQCEASQFPLVPDCANAVSACEDATGVTAVGVPGFPAGTPKADLCEGVLECIRDADSMNCGAEGAEACFCGIGADLTNCISMNNPTGPCRDIMQAAGESTSAQTVSERFVDPGFALGLAISVFRCDQELCSTECFPYH
jgi:cysteine-rich repeat protein